MAKFRTPGILIPTAYSSVDEFEKELQKRCTKAGFTLLDSSVLEQSALSPRGGKSMSRFLNDTKPPLDEALEHHGIKGMRWGVRRNSASGVPHGIDRQARKDAHEFARAKMFYGQGAGTRRKLINAKVEAGKKRSSDYSKAFDHHLARQDMSSHASKAQSERTRKNVAGTTRKTGGAIARGLTGEMGTTAAFVALAGAGVAFSRTPQGQAMMRTSMKKVSAFASSTVIGDVQRKRAVNDLLRSI